MVILADKKTTVYYHANCLDGFTAAWVFHTYLRNELRWDADFIEQNCKFIPMRYGQKIIADDVEGRNVVILDFSFERDVMRLIMGLCASLVVLDHHKTAKENLEGLEAEFFAGHVSDIEEYDLAITRYAKNRFNIIFDMEKSGARLAWDYFIGKDGFFPPPKLVQYVEDWDLWKKELAEVDSINAYLKIQDKTFYLWDAVASVLDDRESFWEAVDLGDMLLKQDQWQREQLKKNLHKIEIIGHVGIAVNAPYFHASTLGNEICKENSVDFAAIYQFLPNGKVKFSLRSIGDFDVSFICKHFQGGGHKNAAGFEVDADRICWRKHEDMTLKVLE